MAYLLGTYPALTETFVLREMIALRERGLAIVVGAARRPDMAQRVACPEGLADVTCLYARPDRLPRHLLAFAGALLRRPRRTWRALRTFRRAAGRLPPREGARLLYHFVAGVGFAGELRRLGVRHVHSHFTSATNMALAAHLVEGLPFSFTAHASDDLYVQPVLMPEKTAAAEFVVAVCEYSRRYLDSLTGFRHSAKLHRIYNGIAEPGPDLPRNGSEAAPRIVSVGSLVSAKGHASLIQACAVLRHAGVPFTCRIIGEGPERATLERLVRDLGLGDRVALAGAHPPEKVQQELAAADVFALATEIGPGGYRDGFPTVVLEAMAAALPVVSTSLSGIPEMVEHGVTGLLVQERDPDAVAKALDCLLSSPELRRTMGQAGRARVRERFPLARSADELAALLRSALARVP